MSVPLLLLALIAGLAHAAAAVGVALIAPALPSSPVLGIAGAVLALFAFAGLVPTASRAWMAPACFALPVGLLGLDFPDEIGALEVSLRITAVQLGVEAVLWGLAAWLFVGGPRHHGVERLVPYLVVVALWGQAVELGLQILLPGVLLHGAFALLPVVAARADVHESWVLASLRAIGRAPGAWVVAWGGTGLTAALSMSGVVLLVGAEGILDPTAIPTGHQLAFGAASAIGTGLSLSLASWLYERAEARVP